MRSYFIFCNKKCRIYAASGVSQTPNYKEDKEGISTMCKAVEDMIREEKKSMAVRMLEVGKMTIDEIAKCSDLSVEEVKELAKNL